MKKYITLILLSTTLITYGQQRDKPGYRLVGETFTIDNFSVTINSVKFEQKIACPYGDAEAKGFFCIINLTFKNNDTADRNRSLDLLALKDEDEKEYEFSSEGTAVLMLSPQGILEEPQYKPNMSQNANEVYQVPVKKKYYLHITDMHVDLGRPLTLEQEEIIQLNF